jgi:hypothetical protein
VKIVIVIVITVALASFGLGHYLGQDSLRPRLLLVEQTLETVLEHSRFKDYVIKKCTAEYTESSGEPFTASLIEYISETRVENTDLGEKDFHGDDNQMEL